MRLRRAVILQDAASYVYPDDWERLFTAVESLLAAARAEAAAEALEQAATAAGAHTKAGTHVHIFYQAEEWLRARAAEFRRAGQQQKEGQ